MPGKGTEAGKAYVTLGLNAESLEKGLKSAGDKVGAMGKRVAVAGAAVAGAGAAVLAPLLAATSSFAKMGDDLDKTSLRIGVNVTSLSELAFAAEQSGASLQDIEKGFAGLSRAMFDASRGSAEAVDSLTALGLSVVEMDGLSPEEQFNKVADALSKMDDASRAGAIAQKLFGRAGRQLLPMLQQGTAGINALRQEANELGRSMSGDDAAAAAEYTDAMNRVSSVWKGLKQQVGAALAPALAEVATNFAQIAVGVVEFVRENRGIIQGVAAAAAAVVGLGTALSVAGVAIIGIGMAITSLGTIVGLVLSPAGILIVGMAAAAAAAAHYFGFIGKATDWLAGAFETLSRVFSQNFGTILDELKAGNIEGAMEVAAEAIELVWLDLGEGMLDWWDEVVSGLASRIQDFVTAAKESFNYLGELMSWFDNKYGDIYNKVYKTIVGRLTEMGGVRTIGEYNVDAYSQDPILNMSLDDYITTPEEREERSNDRARRRRELEERSERRAREREERLENERRNRDQQDAYNRRQELGDLDSLSLADSSGELDGAAGKPNSRGTFSAFAARALGAGTYQEKLLKANKDTAKNTADIAKNTAMPNLAVFNA